MGAIAVTGPTAQSSHKPAPGQAPLLCKALRARGSSVSSLSPRTTSKSEAQSDVCRRLRIGVAEVEPDQGGAVIARTSAVALPLRDWAGDRRLPRRPVLPQIV